MRGHLLVAAILIVGCGNKTESKPSAAVNVPGLPAGVRFADCAYQKSDNCWRKLLASVKACMGAPAETADKTYATLSDDKKTCAYTDGRVISFERPLAGWRPGVKDLAFTASKGDKQCLKYSEIGTALDLDKPGSKEAYTITAETPDVKVTVEHHDFAWTLTCGDGEKWGKSLEAQVMQALGNGSASVSCAQADSMLPNSSFHQLREVSRFILSRDPMDDGVEVFACKGPETAPEP